LHELSLAHGIIETILGIAKQNMLRTVDLIEISVGEMSQIDTELLSFWLKELSKETPIKSAEFKITIEKSRYKCRSCGYEWSWEDVKKSVLQELCGENEECDNPIHFIPELANVFMKCPKCKSLDFEIIGGTGIKIVRIMGSR